MTEEAKPVSKAGCPLLLLGKGVELEECSAQDSTVWFLNLDGKRIRLDLKFKGRISFEQFSE